MIKEHEFNRKKYTMSNDFLTEGDQVFPISNGKISSDGEGYLHEYFDFRYAMSGFPDEPHTILDLHHSRSKSHQVQTTHGYGPEDRYFKIIKVEDI